VRQVGLVGPIEGEQTRIILDLADYRVAICLRFEAPRLRVERKEKVLFSADVKRVVECDVGVIEQLIERWSQLVVVL